MNQTPRLLVIGGSGFIGRRVVQRGLDRGWRVTSLDLSVPVGRRPAGGARYLVADIGQKNVLSKALAKKSFEYVVNCGGHIDHAGYFDGGRKVFDTHFGGLRNLVDLLERQVLLSLVNLGSSDEYGNAPAPQREDQREAPISPYSFGKLAATHFLQMLHRAEDFPGVTLRLFLCYGPGQGEARFLPQVIRGCLRNESFPTTGGRQRRDLCFVDDVTAAIFAALTSPSAKGEIINIGSGCPISIRQVIETVRDLAGGGIPLFGRIAYRRGENMELFPDIAKAKTLLSWSPKIGLEAGLKKTIAWMKENP